MPKKKNFITLLCEIRDLDRKEAVDALSAVTDANGGIRCPVPGCGCKTVFKRWGDMRGHFLDDSSHKRDYFKAYLEKMHEPFCDQSGAGFNHGVNSLMLALIRQPTAIEELTKDNKKTTVSLPEPSVRLRRSRPVQEQQELLAVVSDAPESTLEAPVASEPEAIQPKATKRAFSFISEFIRDSEEINKIWRGAVWDYYVEMFHGIPPCFHCRSEEGKQIHHQNPLFHEIILVSLNKLGTTAEMVVEALDGGDRTPYEQLLAEVFAFHMKAGKVCAVPYCQGCNQDAEIKRRKGKAGKSAE